MHPPHTCSYYEFSEKLVSLVPYWFALSVPENVIFLLFFS